jgi:hypothetical protein
MSANGSLTATGVLLWCPPQRTLDKAFSWKAQRLRGGGDEKENVLRIFHPAQRDEKIAKLLPGRKARENHSSGSLLALYLS